MSLWEYKNQGEGVVINIKTRLEKDWKKIERSFWNVDYFSPTCFDYTALETKFVFVGKTLFINQRNL